jgi:aspartate carbamoyltransferase catalytic subunit
MAEAKIKTIRSMVNEINFIGCSLLSINDLTDDQIYGLFNLALVLEPFNRSMLPLVTGNVMSTLFFQPSTRTRMSFETAMHRLGGAVISEANPMVTSSAAKEESLSDMLKVVSKYANVIVMRHFNDVEARQAAPYSDSPIINGGWGHWEHPTQAMLDLYTLYRTYGKIEGLKVCVASADLIEARTGHSMAQGLARLGAKVVLASPNVKRIPEEVREKIASRGIAVEEAFDLNQDTFNELISDMDMVYLPGCRDRKSVV